MFKSDLHAYFNFLEEAGGPAKGPVLAEPADAPLVEGLAKGPVLAIREEPADVIEEASPGGDGLSTLYWSSNTPL